MRAASLAVKIEENLGVRPRLEVGSPGEFRVYANGELIAERSPKLWLRMLGLGWPNEAEVVRSLATLRASLASA